MSLIGIHLRSTQLKNENLFIVGRYLVVLGEVDPIPYIFNWLTPPPPTSPQRIWCIKKNLFEHLSEKALSREHINTIIIRNLIQALRYKALYNEYCNIPEFGT